MKFGCCANIDELGVVKASGADFIEFPLVKIMQADIDLLKASLDNASVCAYSFNLFLPASLKITGPLVAIKKTKEYVDEALRRVHYIGGKVVVFGSGKSRSYPSSFPERRAKNQLIDFLKVAAEYAEKYKVKVAIEPLNKNESNIINTCLEALELAQIIDSFWIGVLIDNYHADIEGEPLSNLEKIGKKLYHVHISDKRRLPPGKGNYNFERLFEALRDINYEGYISIECSWEDKEKELPWSLRYLKEKWEKVV